MWDIKYGTLTQACFHDILRLPKVKWIVQWIRDRFLQPIKPNFQMRLLERLVELHSAGKATTVDEMLVEIHGSAVRLSNDNYTYRKNLDFLVDSLVDSGNAIRKTDDNEPYFIEGENIKPTPKAISTLAEFEIETTRHRDSIRLTRYQLFLGWAMFAIAAATLIVGFFGKSGGSIP